MDRSLYDQYIVLLDKLILARIGINYTLSYILIAHHAKSLLVLLPSFLFFLFLPQSFFNHTLALTSLDLHTHDLVSMVQGLQDSCPL